MTKSFHRGLQRKIRFQLNGVISMEDLYDLSTTQLSNLYAFYNKKIEDKAGGLLAIRRTKNTDDALRCTIIKEVFDYKVEQADKAEKRKVEAAIREEKAQMATTILAKRKLEDMENLTDKELKQLVK